jgi:hypothetical protein
MSKKSTYMVDTLGWAVGRRPRFLSTEFSLGIFRAGGMVSQRVSKDARHNHKVFYELVLRITHCYLRTLLYSSALLHVRGTYTGPEEQGVSLPWALLEGDYHRTYHASDTASKAVCL